MGGAPSLKPFTLTFPPFFPIFVLVTITSLILVASTKENNHHDTKENVSRIPGLQDDNGGTTTLSSPPPVSSTGTNGRNKSMGFKPSMAIIVGVLTSMFSLTFLILLYIKHCNSGHTFVSNSNGESRLRERKNSGIERTVVEALPLFRFGSLRGQKHGLECAVCLNGFEDPEVLRLLPKCKHAFHVECVDTWLGEHSTCPLCRDKLNSEEREEESSLDIESGRVVNDNALRQGNVGSTSRRVSSVGERESGLALAEIIIQARESATTSFRRSLDSANSGGSSDNNVHRLEHRIIVSPSRGEHRRWSDLESSDLLYLAPDMIIADGSFLRQNDNNRGRHGGRSVSAMTGLKRFLSRGRGRERGGGGREQQERQREGVHLRWMAWTSRSQSQRDVP